MSEDKKPNIYVFINAINSLGVEVLAISEDGEILAGHFSSNESWARHDMGIGSERKHDRYHEAYPDGFSLVWCGTDTGAGITEALRRASEVTE